jgi:short-subunit dehydrogenase
VLLTGASEGIGRALALRLARPGVHIALVARNRERLESLARECAALGAATLVLPADIGVPAQCARAVADAAAAFGGLDVLVSNAGATMWARFDALADDSIFDELMRVNYLPTVHLVRAALPLLTRSRGLIVAIASVAGFTGVPERTAYAGSKHALVGFLESLRIELAGSGIDVSIVAPDFVRSEAHRRARGADGRPLGASPLEQRGLQSAGECAALIVRGMERRQRLVVTSLRARLGLVLKGIAPGMIDWLAARAIRLRR